MSFIVQIEHQFGSYSASILGEPSLRVSAATREAAITLLRNDITRRIECGDIVLLDIPTLRDVSEVHEIFANDTSLDEIRDEAYRERDAERDWEFPPQSK